jgi:hypothetical protein
MRKREIERRERAGSWGKNPRTRDRKKKRYLGGEPLNLEEPRLTGCSNPMGRLWVVAGGARETVSDEAKGVKAIYGRSMT